MLVVLKKGVNTQNEKELQTLLSSLEYKTETVDGITVLVVGDETARAAFESLSCVESVSGASVPFPLASFENKGKKSVITVKGVSFGDGSFPVIAGPCTIESEEMLFSLAEECKAAGASMLRGGAFKPRTSPYSFQGLGREGIELLIKIGKSVGLPTVSEIMDISALELFEGIDVIQIGARNMQNFELLKELGRSKKTIMLKRGLSSTLKEWLLSAEYILSGGNENVILCERGIRTFETATRFTLDLSCVPALRELTHLPVIVDPSHATGNSAYVKPMSLAAAACGADGLMIEVHNDKIKALCDGKQSIHTEELKNLISSVSAILPNSYR